MEKDQLLNEILEKSKTIANTNSDLTDKIKKNESIVFELSKDIEDLKNKFIGETNLLDNIAQLRRKTSEINSVNEQLNRNISLLKQDLATSTEHIHFLKKQVAEKSALPFKIARKIGKDVVIKSKELDSLKKQMAGIVEANKRLNENMHLLSMDLVNRERHVDVLRKQLAKKTALPFRVARSIRADLENKESELNQLRQRIDKANESNKELVEKLDYMRGEIHRKDDHVLILKRQLTKKYEIPFKISRKLSEVVAEKERELSSMKKQVDEKRVVIAKLNKIMSTMENDTIGTKTENRNLLQSELLLKQQLRKIANENGSLNDALSALKQDAAEKEKELEALKERVSKTTTGMGTVNTTIKALRHANDSTKRANKELAERLNYLEDELKRKDDHVLILKRQLTKKYEVPFKISRKLSEAVSEKENEINSMKKQVDEKRAVIARLNKILASMENDAARISAENTRARQSEAFLKQQLKKIVDENMSLTEVSSALKQGAAAREKEMGTLKKKVSEATESIDDVKTTIQALRYTRDLTDRANKELILELVQLRDDKKKLGKLIIERDNELREKSAIVDGIRHELTSKTREAADEGKKDKNLREETKQLVKVVNDYKRKESELKIKIEFLKKMVEEEAKKNLDLRAEMEVLKRTKK